MNPFKENRVTLGLMFGVIFAVHSASAALSAKSYIADGLVGHWDGVSNVSLDGDHDPNATQWNDLSGNGPAIPVPAGAAFQANGLQTARSNGSIPDTTASAAILNAVRATKYTVEIAYDMTAGSASATAYSRMLTLGNDDYWVGANGGASELGISPVYDAWGGGLTRTTAVRPDATGAHSFSCLQNGAEVWVRNDGTNVYGWGMSDAQGIRELSHGFRFNRGWYEDVGLDGTYHSIRIYDRCLTDDEKAINLAVDRVRFFGWDPESIELPDGWRFNTEDGVRLETMYAATVSGDGTVSVNDGTAGAAVDFWGEYNGETMLNLTAVPATGYVFARWRGVKGDVMASSGEFVATGNVQAVFYRADAPQLSAKSYIADGLVGHWDGVSNVSLDGDHDPNATQWNDLSGKGPAIPVPVGAAFQANGLQTARSNGSIPDTTASAAILNAVRATKYTVEIAYDMTAGSASATAYSRMLTLGNDDYWVGANGGSSELGISPVYDAWGGGLTRTTAVRPDATGAHSFSCLQNGAEVWVRNDGTNVYGWGMSDAQGIRELSHGFRFNRGWYEDVGLDGTYHSIRIYDRCLTDDEKAINLAVDRVRFFGWDPESIELPDGWRFNTEDGVKLESIHQVSVVDPEFGSVSVDGGEAASSVPVWIDQSAPTGLRVSAVPAEGYKFKKWIGNVDPADATVQDGEISVTGDVQAKFSKISGCVLMVR